MSARRSTPARAWRKRFRCPSASDSWVSFYPFDQDEYLEIVAHWLRTFGCSAKEIEASREETLQWSLQRGSRSGRVAYQFARDWAGKHSKKK